MLAAPIITLTTDWGTSDFFVGMVKGRLISLVPEVRLVDITHEIPRGDLVRTATIVRNACFGFPADTIHMIDVGSSGPYVLIRCRNQYFICCDNGMPHAVFGGDCESMVLLEEPSHESQFLTFPAYSLFCQVAGRLCSGEPMESLGKPFDALIPLQTMGFMEVPDGLMAYVNYIDHYGNADLSIRYEQFEQVRRGRRFVLRVREYETSRFSRNYADVEVKDGKSQGMLLTVSASGYLQLAMPGKSASQYAGLRVLEQIRFSFVD